MKKKKTSLEDTVEGILNILLFANYSLSICEFLISNSTREDELRIKSENFVKRRNDFFNHTLIINWRIAIIELHKLFSTSEDDIFRLKFLFKNVGSEGEYSEKNISSEKIKLWETLMLNQVEVIRKIKIERHNLYAHTSINFKTIESTIQINELRNLSNLVKDILMEIKYSAFGLHLIPERYDYNPTEFLKRIVNDLIDKEYERRKYYASFEKDS